MLSVFVVIFIVNSVISQNLLKLKFNIDRDAKTSLGFVEDSYFNFTELAKKYGYKCEEHVVITKDGYILRLFRIPHRLNKIGKVLGVPVLAVHGIADSADSWIFPGPGYALGYYLVDAGYDMWFTNYRGNKYSRRHTSLNPDKDVKFWRFSSDEIAQYDISAVIDYILKVRCLSTLNYIGHSQGTSVFFRMGAYEPDYYTKVNIMISLASIAWQTHTYNPVIRQFSKILPRLEVFGTDIGLQEILADSAIIQESMDFMCQFIKITSEFCNFITILLGGDDLEQIREEIIPLIWGHFPSGTSLHNLIQAGQGFQTEKFQRFDYGFQGNMKSYGKPSPPEYNVSLVTTPVALFIGENDWLSSPKDTAKLRRYLPKVVENYVIPNKKWTHLDFLWGKNSTQFIGDKIITLFMKYS